MQRERIDYAGGSGCLRMTPTSFVSYVQASGPGRAPLPLSRFRSSPPNAALHRTFNPLSLPHPFGGGGGGGGGIATDDPPNSG